MWICKCRGSFAGESAFTGKPVYCNIYHKNDVKRCQLCGEHRPLENVRLSHPVTCQAGQTYDLEIDGNLHENLTDIEVWDLLWNDIKKGTLTRDVKARIPEITCAACSKPMLVDEVVARNMNGQYICCTFQTTTAPPLKDGPCTVTEPECVCKQPWNYGHDPGCAWKTWRDGRED